MILPTYLLPCPPLFPHPQNKSRPTLVKLTITATTFHMTTGRETINKTGADPEDLEIPMIEELVRIAETVMKANGEAWPLCFLRPDGTHKAALATILLSRRRPTRDLLP